MLKSNWRSLQNRRRIANALYGNIGVPTWDFDPDAVIFDPGMAKRTTSVFAAAPIVQGAWDGTGTGDVLSFSRGSQISGNFYDNIDMDQGSISFWITPEWDGDDGLIHHILVDSSSKIQLRKMAANTLRMLVGTQSVSVDVSSWTSGTTYFVVARWDSKNTIDGTNYISVSINDSHTFGATTAPGNNTAGSTLYVGTNNGLYNADAIIEGLTIYREVLYDGTYGTDYGNGDVINLAYNAGSGADPTLYTGSWGVVFCLPTNATAGALTTGTGNAWSHPNRTALLTDTFCETTYGSSGWSTKGTPSAGPADITAAQRIYNWGYEFTVDADGEGIEQTLSGQVAGSNYIIRCIAHEDDGSDIRLLIYDATNGAAISTYLFGSGSDKDTPGVALITWELPTIARNGVAADCTSVTISVEGTNAGQTVYVHQVEVQANLIDNPSLETGAGNPWIPDGWSNNGLAAGEGIQQLANVHSGTACMEISVIADSDGIRQAISSTASKFYSSGFWGYEVSGTVRYVSANTTIPQYTATAFYVNNYSGATWKFYPNVFRRSTTSGNEDIIDTSAAGGNGYLDDAYWLELDDVSLTVTPASEANSQESGGVRVDGYDNAPAPIDTITATSGKVRFRYIPRHDSDSPSFGNITTVPALAYKDVNNRIFLTLNKSTKQATFQIRVGGVITENTAISTVGLFSAATECLIEFEYNPTSCILRVDGIAIDTLIPIAGIDFGANIPDTFYPGSSAGSILQDDAVFKAP